jgi:hypothetical protein
MLLAGHSDKTDGPSLTGAKSESCTSKYGWGASERRPGVTPCGTSGIPRSISGSLRRLPGGSVAGSVAGVQQIGGKYMPIRLRPSSVACFPAAARKVLTVLALCATVLVPMEVLGTATAGAAGPSTAVYLPSNSSTVAGNVWVDASAQSPAGVAAVHFEVSGGSIIDQTAASTFPTIYGWLGGWNTADVPNGNYTLQSVVTDKNGKSATSPGVSVTVDNLPLHTQMLVPATGATVGGNVILDASAQGTAPVTGVTFTATQGSTVETVATAAPTIYGWIGEWTSGASAGPGYANGTWSIQSVATEVGGTTATSSHIEITLVTLADLQSSSMFTGNQYPGLAGCQLGASYLATYPGSTNVGTVTLTVNPCPSAVFTLTTGVGTVEGSVGQGVLEPIPPEGVEATYPLEVATGTGLFTGTTGTLFFESGASGTAPFTGSVTLTS